MKFRLLVSLLFCLLTVNAQAIEIDHCPVPGAIKNTHGIYTAPTVSRKGQWVGTVATPRSNIGDKFSADAVLSFQGAVFLTTQENGVARGVLSRCMYSSVAKEPINLYFRSDVRPAMAVKLLDLKNWELLPASATGLNTYLCKSKQQGGCVFAVVE